jgi:ribosomal protein S4
MVKGHRTASGKMIDMDALRAKNERVRAVGNMNVNARGDIIDANDKIVNDNAKRVNEQYMKSIAKKTNIIPDIRSTEQTKNEPVSSSKLTPDTEPKLELTPEELEFEQDDLEQTQELEQTQTKKSKSSKKS